MTSGAMGRLRSASRAPSSTGNSTHRGGSELRVTGYELDAANPFHGSLENS
jgi:hypothetical protein